MDLTLNAQASSATPNDSFAFSLSLSSELTSLINEHETGKVLIEFQSNEKGTIFVNGEVLFDIIISDSKLIEPYKLNTEKTELTNCGQVLGRCTTTSRDTVVHKFSSSSSRNKDGTINGITTQRSANKIDIGTVHLAASNGTNTVLHSPSRKKGPAVMQPVDTKQSALTSSEQKAQKKRPLNGIGKSCVVVRAVPLRTTVGQIDQFMSGLSAIEMFSFPYQLEHFKSTDGNISFEGMTDVYVVFNSAVSATLAKKRSGEVLCTPSSSSSSPSTAAQDSSTSSSKVKAKVAVKPIVEIVTEAELFWPKGIGMCLSLSSKSTSTSTKLESIWKYSQHIFRNQHDKDIFQQFLFQDCMKIRMRIQDELDGIVWRTEAVFAHIGPEVDDATAASLTHKNKKRKMKCFGIDLDANSMYAPAEVVPPQWNPSLICNSLSLADPAVSLTDSNLGCTTEDIAETLRRVQHLQGVCIIAATRIQKNISSIRNNYKQEGEIDDYLSRLQILFSTVNCLLWRKSIM